MTEVKVICDGWDRCNATCEHCHLHIDGPLGNCHVPCSTRYSTHGSKCRPATDEEVVFLTLLEQGVRR